MACATALEMIAAKERHPDTAGQRRRATRSAAKHVLAGRREAATHHGGRGSADQSNSVAFLNDRCALKLFRRIEPTPNPEFEIGRFLTDARFTRTPALMGALEYLRPGLEPGTLAIVQTPVKHQGFRSGTSRSTSCAATTSACRRVRADARGRPLQPLELPPMRGKASTRRTDRRRSSRRSNTGICRPRRRSGRRTAELHLALASGT